MGGASSISDSTKGIIMMIVAALILTLNDALSKHLTETYSIWQVIAGRQVFSLLLILAYVHFSTGWSALHVTNRSGIALRSLIFVATTGFIVGSFAVLPLAFVTAIAFSSPLIVVALSHVLGYESVGFRRWAAVIAGFVGVLIIVRPGGANFEWLVLLPVAADISAGLRDIVTRRLSRTESSISILLWSNIAAILFSVVMVAFDGWREVDVQVVALLALNGLFNALAHFLMIDSLRLGEASLVAPFRYSGLIWAIMLGFVFWGDLPGLWTIVGATVLVASGIYIIERQPRIAK